MFTHPKGLLFTTQFMQITLVVTLHPAFEDMRSKGLIQLGVAFTGHSQGKFSALTAIADISPNSSLVDIMFYHSLTMQHAVEHDKQGCSNYAMCTINPAALARHLMMQPFMRLSTPSY